MFVRTPAIWWTQNCKYNAAFDVHRLNVDNVHALDALDTGVDSYRGVRQAFARDCPDMVAYQIVLRTELNMRIVMPSVIRHSERWPYQCMARFETGTLGGNLHAHGFSCGEKPPRMPRRIKAGRDRDGDETSELSSGSELAPGELGASRPISPGHGVSGSVGTQPASSSLGVTSRSENGYEDALCWKFSDIREALAQGHGVFSDLPDWSLKGLRPQLEHHARWSKEEIGVAPIHEVLSRMWQVGHLGIFQALNAYCFGKNNSSSIRLIHAWLRHCIEDVGQPLHLHQPRVWRATVLGSLPRVGDLFTEPSWLATTCDVEVAVRRAGILAGMWPGARVGILEVDTQGLVGWRMTRGLQNEDEILCGPGYRFHVRAVGTLSSFVSLSVSVHDDSTPASIIVDNEVTDSEMKSSGRSLAQGTAGDNFVSGAGESGAGDGSVVGNLAERSDSETALARSECVQSELHKFLERQDFGRDIMLDDVLSCLLGDDRSEPAVALATSCLGGFLEKGLLEQLSDDMYRRVPPVPKHGHLPRRDNRLGPMRQDRRQGVRAAQLEGGSVEGKPHQRYGVGDKEELEEKLSKYFQELVSSWNPCFTQDGVCRFDWDAEIAAHDMEVDMDDLADLPCEGDALHRWPERARLSTVLRDIFRDKGSSTKKGEVDVQPLRRLVAALVHRSARHDIHGKYPPVIGVHACARGKPGCPQCRYGFPIKELRPRVGGCDCTLVKGDREGQWHLRTPRNDELCCSYEDHVLLANLGNIDWRPCLNLWAVVQYVSKYATKAPKGSRRISEVLSDAVDDVCRFVPKEQDFLRRSIQRFFARTLGERDYHVYEAVHVGLGLPLVVPLLPVVTLNTSGARALKPRAALKDKPAETPVHYDSKLDKFDKRFEIFSRQFLHKSDELKIVLESVKDVSLFEFWWKYIFVRGRFEKVKSAPALMVTPSYGADCANVQHSAHAGYAKACVIAYWRLMPTKARHKLYRQQPITSKLSVNVIDSILGWTELGDPFQVAGFPDRDRFLGTQDLYTVFEGRTHGHQKIDGWCLGLMEMLVDPVLSTWVPKWVREQYERANPYFRRVFEKMLSEAALSNKDFLLRLYKRMVLRHEQSVLRKGRSGEATAGQNSGSSSESGGEGPGGESDLEEGVADEIRQGQDDRDDDAEAVRLRVVHEPRPTVGVEGDEGMEEKDWARAGLEERLSAAGMAQPTADRSTGAIRESDASRGGSSRFLFNPVDYPYEDESVVHWSDFNRLEGLMKSWKGQAVADGADGVERHELDGWQKFAHDIVTRHGQETTSRPIRCFLIGTAGTGKSRTVRSFVGSKRAAVRRKLEASIDHRRLLQPRVQNDIKEAVRHCCQLGAPTGCASFQLKFGASTLHRLFGVPIGYCGPASNRTSESYKLKKNKVRLATLYVLDEMSMIGRRMLGKIEFKIRDYVGNLPDPGGSEPIMGQKDFVLCGDPKQCPPIGDEPIYQHGEYIGKSENKPKDAQGVPAGAWSAKKLVRMGMEVRDSCEDVVILRKVHRYQDFDESVPPEKRVHYADEAAKFLSCTRGMADCTWTPAQRDWLAGRNRSALQQTADGRSQLQRLERFPLLMDTKVDKASGEPGAHRLNQLKLEELSSRTGKPIVALGAHHGKPQDQPDLKPELLDADHFRGMEDKLLMCEGARVLLTDNMWVEAGLMNGALGTLKGYMWPEGGDPNSKDSRLRAPLCLIVEFDDVNLRDEHGVLRSFFPGEPEKARWVPIFKKDVWSSNDEGVCRSQFPLVLAWALTHWKAQGMTLAGARVHLSQKTVGVPGLAFVACTRVRHPWDLVFENDLPEYEHFMKARNTPAFRRRKRWELRLQQRASNTIRKYKFCEEDEWRPDEAAAASSLLLALERVAEKQREMLRDGPGRVVDDDTWLWGDSEPCYEKLLSSASDELQLTDEARSSSRAELFLSVTQRLLDRTRRRVVSQHDCDVASELLAAAQETGHDVDSVELVRFVAGEADGRFEFYMAVARLVRRRLGQIGEWDCRIDEPLPTDICDLHMPAVKAALGALIPAKLHQRFDKAAAKQKLPYEVPRGGSYLRFDGWRVSVYEEESLARGRLDDGMLEFFLKVLQRCSLEMRLRLSVGSKTLGKLVGTAASLDEFRRVVGRWRDCWNPDVALKNEVLLLPVPTVDAQAPRDWVFVTVRPSDGCSTLGEAGQLEVKVYDRVVRKMLSARIARFVQALFPGSSSDVVVAQEDFPVCRVPTQRSACVLGLIAAFVLEHAGQACLDRGSETFVSDFFFVLKAVFAKLRTEAAARGLTDVKECVVGEDARALLKMFGEVPCMRSTSTAQSSADVARHVKDAGVSILKAVTWNISGGQKSAQAPDSWLLADQGNEVVKEILRWGGDVVALQEVMSEQPMERLLTTYNHVGSSGSHRGFVHLYTSKEIVFSDVRCDRPGVVLCKLQWACDGDDAKRSMTVSAVHLLPGLAPIAVRSRSNALSEISQLSDNRGLLILGDMNCKDDEAAQVCRTCNLKEACYAGSSWGSRGNRFHAHIEYEGFGLRYDRMFMSGSVWAETFVAGNRKTFFEGWEFCLSDHHPVIGFFECCQVFQESGRASVAVAGARRARIVALRDLRLREEQVESLELLKRGREDRIVARHAAEEESRVAAWHEQKQAAVARDLRARERWESAFGVQSFWGGEVPENSSRTLATASLVGWEEDGWSVEVPTAVFLRGITSGQTDVVMPCLLQVVLRLPQMQAWIEMHAEHCKNSSACALCWLTTVQRALDSHRNQKNVQVGFLPEGVGPGDVQDMKWVFENFLQVLSQSEQAAGRVGDVLVPGSSSAVITHVDRIFGSFCETRMRCESCGLKSERTSLSDVRIVTLPVDVVDGGVCTVTDLYLQHCMSHIKIERCDGCEKCTQHVVASRLATTPELLILWLDRGVGGQLTSVDVEEDLSLPGLSSLRLVAVVYRALRHDAIATYSCSCRGPMDAWWYFEEGRAPQPIKRFISHVKQKHSCMLFYERIYRRGKAVKRRAPGGAGQSTRSQKRSRKEASSAVGGDPGISSPLKSWPARALKRYPSWVDSLEVERMRQANFVSQAAVRARVCYDELEAGCGELAFGFEIAEQFQNSMNTDPDVVFVLGCVSNALDGLGRSVEDRQFAAFCAAASQKMLAEALDQITRNFEDSAASLEMLRRVTGIVDLETQNVLPNSLPGFENPMDPVVEDVGTDECPKNTEPGAVDANACGSQSRTGLADSGCETVQTSGPGDGSAVASPKPKPRRRLRRVQSHEVEAIPVRRSARIASRSTVGGGGAAAQPPHV